MAAVGILAALIVVGALAFAAPRFVAAMRGRGSSAAQAADREAALVAQLQMIATGSSTAAPVAAPAPTAALDPDRVEQVVTALRNLASDVEATHRAQTGAGASDQAVAAAVAAVLTTGWNNLPDVGQVSTVAAIDPGRR